MILRLVTLLLISLVPVVAQRGREIVVTDVSAAIYATGWELEKEIVIRPLTLQDGLGVSLGIQDGDVVDGATRDSWKADILDELSETLKVWIDGRENAFQPVGVQFILPDPNEFKPLLPEQSLSVDDFMITVTWVAPLPSLKSQIDVEWAKFPSNIEIIPIRLADTLGTRTVQVQRETGKMDAEIRLAANLRKTPVPVQVDQGSKVSILRRALMCASLLLLVVAFFLLKKGRRYVAIMVGSGATILFFVGCFPLGMRDSSEEEFDAVTTVKRVLEGVYYAYQFTDREAQYDAMEQSLCGDALEASFLEAAAAMGMREREGSRVRVRSVTINTAEILEKQGEKSLVRTDWTTLGEMGHWGHFHKVKHSHRADVSLVAHNGSWKGMHFRLNERIEEK